MSRSRKRAKAERKEAASDADTPTSNKAAPSPVSRGVLLLVAGVVIAWWIALIGMVAFTANPVTLNRRQLNNSPFVVTATITDLKSGRAKVEKEWKAGRNMGEITIPALSRKVTVAGAGAPIEGGTYILPLSISPDGFRITSIASKEKSATIYPANESTLRQLEDAFEE